MLEGERDTFWLLEYEKLKDEQAGRIRQRDGFINLNIVALALVASYAGADARQSIAWLAIPWISSAFGWAYLANDDKITAIGRYLRRTIEISAASTDSWEHSNKRSTRWAKQQRFGQLIMDLVMFVLPTLLSIAAYASRGPENGQWGAAIVVLVVMELLLSMGVAFFIVAHSPLVSFADDDWG